MCRAAFLIAEREFRTYVATLSFWLALAIGPVLAVASLALAPVAHAPARFAVAVHAQDARLAQSAARALSEAGRIEKQDFAVVEKGESAALTLTGSGVSSIALHVSKGFPLSAEGRLLVARTLERDLARAGVTGNAPVSVSEIAAPIPDRESGAPQRFVMVAILWFALTGSLGMLLQAVVRERANRALEGLLAATGPREIMAGKIAGVGAVSALVLVAWLGCVALLSSLAPHEAGSVARVLHDLARPAMLARAAAIYMGAYLFYGTVTFGLGAMARDSAAAQNLSRPMFAILLAAFFVALACALGAHEGWLLYVPPFTPFLLLMHAPESLPLASQVEAVGALLVATVAAAWLAIARLTVQNSWAAGAAG
ncbi:MAG TPA: ABC transporter permease [Rhizomicrobium sp.]|jgi:ABC-2 type transport system permease protein